MTSITTFADAEAQLASNLPGYQSRKPQQIGAEAVERAFEQRIHAAIQAGCGVGKSYMTLIPAILRSVLHGERTVVATATKALQSQLINKDLPFLEANLGVPFRWAMLQGRSNYFCGNRAAVVAGEEPLVAKMAKEASEPGFDGLRSSFSFDIPGALWAKVQGSTDECGELGCREPGQPCFAYQARRKASDCGIVVINHSLLCMDLMLQDEAGFGLIGEYDNVVIDEAHNLEGYCKSALGWEFSQGAILGAMAELRNFVNREMDLQAEKVLDTISTVNSAQNFLWMAFEAMMEDNSSTLRIKNAVIEASMAEWEGLAKALWACSKLIDGLADPTEAKPAKRWRLIKSRVRRLAARFSSIVLDPQDKTVRWLTVKTNARRERQIVIASEPLFVDEFLSNRLFANHTVVLCSATMMVDRSFEFLAHKLGLDNHVYEGTDVGTMFNFPEQGRFFAPRQFPEPTGKTKTQWEAVVPNAMLELVRASQGRALLLFTSLSAMKRAYEVIEPQVPFTCLMQNQQEVPVLAQKFKEDTHSILFATRSFMEGIDVQGESLSLVVLDKLIFKVPSEPVAEAMKEVIEARGGNFFKEVDLPEMMLILEQAAGRLIRTVTDKGVFALLDPRVWTKNYGSKVRSAIPPFTQIESLGEVQSFFESL